MATRRSGEASYDHGAQFISVRDERFRAAVDGWIEAGVATLWANGFADGLTGDGSLLAAGSDGGQRPHTPARDGHPRYRGAPGMTAIPKHLAADLPVRFQWKARSVTSGPDGGWICTSEDGDSVASDRLIITAPVPQALALLKGLPIDRGARAILEDVSYAPCLVLLGQSTTSLDLPEPGVLRFPTSDVEWIADNYAKGVSKVPNSITVHCGYEFSRDHYDEEDESVFDLINQSMEAQLNRSIEWQEWQVKRWRYSRPLEPLSVGAWREGLPAGIVLAGDAFAGARVEGAVLSGITAADAV